MELIRYNLNDEMKIKDKLAIALGQFDGLHLAHTMLIQEAVKIAKEKNIKSAVLTFDPHPDFILKKRENHGYITPITSKANYIASLGVDYLIIINFNLEVSQLAPEDFEKIFLFSLDIDTLIAGFDFRYGRMGKGSVDRLKELHRFSVIKFEEVKYENQKMGSELVRQYLEAGELEHVTNILGRYYNITGKVVPGNKVGRKMGFKTANIDLEENYHFLRKGVYGVFVYIENKRYLGVCNIGNNPSINYTERPRLEVHIFDFDEYIYNQEISVDFVFFIRDEIKFDSIEELIKQINKDVIYTKENLIKFVGVGSLNE